ncbi:unnamed protein product [Symbiodinium natans]|uniref:Uncharacterized protein n=1 Tax=Symbiodinium natans TaxID=878477 RepID=A0A812IA70_9DINO|nr:unnamed protein product [Symbiodinium natans]
MVRQWQRNLRSEARGLDRSIRKIEQEEDKIRKDIQAKDCSTLADPDSVFQDVRRLGLHKTQADEAQQMSQTGIDHIHEKGDDARRQLLLAVVFSLIEELIDEGMEEMDGPDLEVEAACCVASLPGPFVTQDPKSRDGLEAEAEVDKVLDWDDLAVDASIRMAISKPQDFHVPHNYEFYFQQCSA